ncbi:putative membrane protein [Camellia lanceoleosa]|uniref:Membrane protein n=1 Tax=Camellia lanceoleosa TaxID=1840588 RepID=A0ACC0I1G7_9ERIC|nr:putative membrane protein [Camellia lanceoleosa]
MFAIFKAVDEGKTDKFYHCIYDGTSDTVKQSFTFVRDFMDICYHFYFSVTDDLRSQGHQDGKYFEISLIQLGKMPENALKDGEKERSSNSSMQKNVPLLWS